MEHIPSISKIQINQIHQDTQIQYNTKYKYSKLQIVDVGKPMLAGYPTLDVDALASRPLQRALYIGLEMCFSFYLYIYTFRGLGP